MNNNNGGGFFIMKTDPYKTWFVFTLIYLIIDYGRPQEVLPQLAFLKPGMIIIIILSCYLFLKGHLAAAWSRQTTMILLFCALLACYVPFAVNNYYAFTALFDMLTFIPFILSAIICIDSVDRIKKVIFLIVCIMVYISIHSLITPLYDPKAHGAYFKDENDYSLFLNMWMPFCYFLFLIEKDRLKKYIYMSGLIIAIIAVIHSFSRGGFVGMLCVGAVCWLQSSKKLVSLFVISAIAVMVLFFASDEYWERIGTTEDVDHGTAAERIESWKSGWAMFLDNPLGVGGENFPVRFPEYQTDYFKKGMWGRAAHSIWVMLLCDTGILGIIIYLMLVKYNVKDILFLRRVTSVEDDPDLRYLHSLSSAFTASIVGYFTSGTFLSVLYYPHYWYLTSLIVAASGIAKKMTCKDDSAVTDPQTGISETISPNFVNASGT